MRWPTQDFVVVKEVLMENQYRLPPSFEPTDVIVDIGAQVGGFAYACLDRGCGKVICYEPEDRNFALLRANMAPWKNKAELHNFAVWRSACTVQMHSNKNQFTAMHQTLGYGDEPVPAVSLDDVLRDLGPVRLLKLDCEGAEKPILDGATSLEQVQELMGELHYKCPEKDGEAPTDEWLQQRLGDLGFKAMRFQDTPSTVVRLFWAWRKREHAHGRVANYKR